jgi:hypothetical protein
MISPRFRFLCLLATAGLFLSIAIAAKENTPWAEQLVTGMGTNIWAPEWLPESITKWDPDKLADSLAKAGVQVAFTFQGFSQDHFGVSYFPTRLGPVHRNLNGRDHLREYIDALHKRKVKVFGYYSFPDKGIWEKNPDWRQLDANGVEIRPAILAAHFVLIALIANISLLG